MAARSKSARVKLIHSKVEQIADELEQEPGRISQICQIAEKYAPAYDQEAIYLDIAEF